MSLTATTRIAGMVVATIRPRFGTPKLLSFSKRDGNSPSRDIKNEIAIKSTIAVLTADSNRKPKTPVTIQPAGGFTWQVNQKGKTQSFAGSSTYGDGLLTLVQDKGPVLVGRVSWTDAGHITFRVVGDGPDDPGLSFSK